MNIVRLRVLKNNFNDTDTRFGSTDYGQRQKSRNVECRVPFAGGNWNKIVQTDG